MKTSAIVQTTPDGMAVLGIVEHNGKTFTAGGGHISDAYCYCYPKADGTVGTWDGPIEGARIIKRTTYRQWNPFSGFHESRTCYRIKLADGRIYSGRNSGDGMLLKARRVKG